MRAGFRVNVLLIPLKDSKKIRLSKLKPGV